MIASLALQKAILEALQSSPELTAILGENRIHDDVPPGAKPPYLVFAQATERPLGGTLASGSEHLLSLVAWSAGKGRNQAARIADAVRVVVGTVHVLDPPQQLILLDLVESKIRREPETGFYRAEIELRAFTE